MYAAWIDKCSISTLQFWRMDQRFCQPGCFVTQKSAYHFYFIFFSFLWTHKSGNSQRKYPSLVGEIALNELTVNPQRDSYIIAHLGELHRSTNYNVHQSTNLCTRCLPNCFYNIIHNTIKGRRISVKWRSPIFRGRCINSISQFQKWKKRNLHCHIKIKRREGENEREKKRIDKKNNTNWHW